MKELSIVQMEELNGGTWWGCALGIIGGVAIGGVIGGTIGGVLFCTSDAS